MGWLWWCWGRVAVGNLVPGWRNRKANRVFVAVARRKARIETPKANPGFESCITWAFPVDWVPGMDCVVVLGLLQQEEAIRQFGAMVDQGAGARG